jgi:hypothetical protein
MVDHTPTPWGIDEENCGDGANITSAAGRVAWTSALRRIRGGERIIEAAEAKANAAFIVAAVNAHDDLVAAMKLALPVMSPPYGAADCGAYATAYRAVRDALAKTSAAEGESS